MTRWILRDDPELVDDRDLEEVHLLLSISLIPLEDKKYFRSDDDHGIRLDLHPLAPFEGKGLAGDHDDTLPLIGFGHSIRPALFSLVE
jgi:hypothetical protein